ncbi:MAG: insulinase family protein, partial [Deltaproteobacteria bacterium]|nr:insulinase family protein [Deltaproteobacteria bacterium]
MLHRLLFFMFAVIWLPFSAQGKSMDFPSIDIPSQKHTLSNGLTVIIAEDHKAPLVAVNVTYRVGSKNEPKGRRGFAHLFEHLLFQGSQNFDDDYFKALQLLGATGPSGTTSYDRTNYFQTVPVNALDSILWLESDRMGHFTQAITQAKLDEQRKVVLNEMYEGENKPYNGIIQKHLQQAIHSVNHPYSWNVIGNREDLNAATLDDV